MDEDRSDFKSDRITRIEPLEWGSHHLQDNPLPWQKPLTLQTPERVEAAFASILVNIIDVPMLPKLQM